ncbi:MAG: hypothetical protein ACR2JE_00215 [Acidobacteriaceae bacterium]
MLMRSRLLPMLLLWWCIAATCATAAPSSQAQAAPTHRAPDTPQLATTPSADAQCAHCHRAIYDTYEKTPMAKASGPAVAGLIPGEFTHTKSGVHYRLFVRDGQAWLDYGRPNAPPRPLPQRRAAIGLLHRFGDARANLFLRAARLLV